MFLSHIKSEREAENMREGGSENIRERKERIRERRKIKSKRKRKAGNRWIDPNGSESKATERKTTD